MRVKSLLIVIVLNIFLMLGVSILLEYNNLSERFVSIENTIQEALDSAINTAVGSEEFFSSDFQEQMTSFAGNKGSVAGTVSSTNSSTIIWDKDKKEFVSINTYALAKYYEDEQHLPVGTSEIGMATSKFNTGSSSSMTRSIYEWLYGGTSTDYNHADLTWANRSASKREEYANYVTASMKTRSDANSNFQAFYNNVGQYHRTVGMLKNHVDPSQNSYELEPFVYPTLNNMGFSWMKPDINVYTNLTPDLNETGSSITADNFTSSIHVGKSRDATSYSFYYLTPSSLGVTYIPTEVLKPTFIANLDMIARLNVLGGSSIANPLATSSQVSDILNGADNCVETAVYDGASGHKLHDYNSYTDRTLEHIVTDGLVEYDKASVKVKVDYFCVNFATYNQDKAKVVISKVNGAISSVLSPTSNESQARTNTLQALLNQDTGIGSGSSGGISDSALKGIYASNKDYRIIARVSVRMKVHVPYQSSLLQWMCYRFRPNNRHFDVKLWLADSDNIDQNSDGIWYQYTTYFCQSRS